MAPWDWCICTQETGAVEGFLNLGNKSSLGMATMGRCDTRPTFVRSKKLAIDEERRLVAIVAACLLEFGPGGTNFASQSSHHW